MKPGYCLLATIGLALLAGPTAAERRDHDAHVHGTAELDVAVLGDRVEIELRSPAANLVGFEHQPRTDEQHARLDDAVAALRDGAALFDFGDAECELRDTEVHHEHEAAGDGHDEHGHENHGQAEEHGHAEDQDGHAAHGHEEGRDDGIHSEFRAHYDFACAGPVARLKVGLFKRFPRTGSIRVQYLTEDAQGARTLTPGAATLRLE